jgi:hypothetical protein
MIDKFQRVADVALAAKTKLERSKYAKRPDALRTIRELDQLVNRAYDATAQHLMEGRVPNGGKVLEGLKARLNKLAEGWFVLPALGLGNDLTPNSDGSELAMSPGQGGGNPSLPALMPQAKAVWDKPKMTDRPTDMPDKPTKGFDEADVNSYLDRYLAEDDDEQKPLGDDSDSGSKPFPGAAEPFKKGEADQGKDRDTGSTCECGKPGCECD